MAAWKEDVWRKTSKGFVVPLTRLQAHALRVLAAQRSPDSYVAGGVALNRTGPRFSRDIDIFQDLGFPGSDIQVTNAYFTGVFHIDWHFRY